MNKRNLAGQRFGRLLVIGEGGRSGDNHVLWECQCDCGRSTSVVSSKLRQGVTKSCGCLRQDFARENGKRVGAAKRGVPVTHGHCVYQDPSPTYLSWKAMHARCSNKKHRHYKHYGGRGISVCERWSVFANFLSDMGERPEGMTLDREDNDGNYEPGNCRWATNKQQANNRQPQKQVA